MRITKKQLRKLIREAAGLSPDSYEDIQDLDHEYTSFGRMMGDGGSAGMARGQLFNVAQKAQSLYDRLSDDDELPEWVQSKITMIDDYMNTVDDYLNYEIHRYDSGDPLPVYESIRLKKKASFR